MAPACMVEDRLRGDHCFCQWAWRTDFRPMYFTSWEIWHAWGLPAWRFVVAIS